jgi:hypothetical protein
MKTKTTIRLGLLFLCLIIIPSTANAFTYGQEEISLSLTPPFPQADTIVTARLDDYSIAVPTTDIAWYVNGSLVREANNRREFNLNSGAIGSKTTVRVVATLATGSQISAQKVIEPSFVDLIIEAQTRTPAFYRGRPLPSIGSRVNVVAITALDEIISPQNLVYTWRLNGQTLEGGSLRARNSISFTMPQGNFATLAVDVNRPGEPPFARKVIDIPSTNPRLLFYELNPLYGLIQSAVRNELLMIGNTITVRAEPYNLDLNTYNNPSLLDWQIGGQKVANYSPNPYDLPLELNEAGGLARIGFHVRNTSNVLQGVEDTFLLRY